MIIFLSIFQKLNFDDILIRAIHLHICLFLPVIYFKILIEKFGSNLKEIYFIFCTIIFFSPTFRTLAIWPDSRLLGLIFFSLSILYFLKFKNDNKFNYCLINILFCALSAYFSPNFSVFSIFYFLNYIKHFKILSLKTIIIIFLNILLALPAFYYIFILDINFLNKSASIGFEKAENIIFFNIFNNILLTFSIIFFYLIPFIFTKVISHGKVFSKNNLIISLIIFSLLIINFDYNFDQSGGGIIFKISHFIFKNNILFFIFTFISILFINSIFKNQNMNFLLLFLIFLNNPQDTIYHKYFDPFLIIVFFSLFSLNFNLNKILEFKNLIFIYFYFISFLILNNLRFLWNI